MLLCSRWMWFIKVRQFLFVWMKKLYLYLDLRRILIISSVIVIAVLAILPFVTEKKVRYLPCHVHPSAHNPYRFNVDNSGLSPFNERIVPNIIHFYRSGKDVHNINFIDALCLYSAFRIGNPEKIMIHTDEVVVLSNSFTQSPYGKRLMQVPGFKKRLDIQYWPLPKHVFGIEFDSVYRNSHISDITRLRILRKYGGMFLDNHAFLLKNPNPLFYYEMAAFENKENICNYLIAAHRDARMLDLWLKSYHRYDPDIRVHHHTPYVKSLFLQKTTFYHNFERGVQHGNIDVFNTENGLQVEDYNDCFALYFNMSKMFHFGSEQVLEFESDYVINFVENYVRSIK